MSSIRNNSGSFTHFLIIAILLFPSIIYGQSSQIYSTPGTYTWTVPPCVNEITVEAWGGGGGGGAVWSRFNPTDNGSPSAEACTAAGGGGGGGFARRTYAVTPGQVYTIVVGAGGAGGTVNNSLSSNRAQNGSVGGNSTFSGPATVGPGTLTAFGGNGGFAANFLRSNCNGGCWINHEGVNGNGGTGGSGANGTTMFTGGNGAAGVHSGSTNDRSGAGGGGAGNAANGGNATSITNGGSGGSASGGNGANGIVQPYGTGYLGTNGNNGSTLGGGGGGACGHNRQASSSTHRSNIGGNGARGEVRIYYTMPAMPEPLFTQVPPICSGGPLSSLPTTSNNGFSGTWSPAINNTATTTYVFTPNPSGPCADTASMTIVVNPAVTPAFDPVGPICEGDVLNPFPTTSSNGIGGTWSPGLNNTATTNYTFTPSSGQCATTAGLTVVVNQVPVIFAQPQNTAICANGSTTLSVNASSGPYQWQYFDGTNWVDVINNAPTGFNYSNASGSTLTVTASNATCGDPLQYRVLVGTTGCNLISETATIAVLRASRIAPTGPQCSGTQLNFEACPAGGVYSWVVSPQAGATASPATGNSQNFSFTPTNETGGNQTFPINVTFSYLGVECLQSFNPTIISPPDAGSDGTLTICDGSSPTNAQLFAALNGSPDAGGTWTNVGDVYTYTVSATAPCAPATATVTVNTNQTIPTFNSVGPICEGEFLNPLPTISTNGISGSWSPSLNNQATTTYTFTPDPTECAMETTLMIVVNPPSTVPTFTQVDPVCNGTILSPLPTTSLNGVLGSWSPSIDNTVTTTYLFTPDQGQCAASTNMIIVVDQPIVPEFDQPEPVCEGLSIDPLPISSINGVAGSWSPSINNSATTIYTFTPSAGQCATNNTLTIEILSTEVPTFDAIGPICSGSSVNPLPSASLEGVIGSWTPAFDNQNTTTYTFSPAPGECATSATLDIVVSPTSTPSFNLVPAICAGETLDPLPSTSINGILGSWSPALNNLSTTTYTFTPNVGQCALNTDLTITVNSPSVVPLFPTVNDLCLGSVPPTLNSVSDNGISGTWSQPVSTSIAGTQTYIFTPDPDECGVSTTLNITVVNPLTPLFDPLAGVCQNGITPVLGPVSANGINGVWSPAVSTSMAGVQTYTFTPLNNECAVSTTTELVVYPLPFVNAGQDVQVCEGQQITLTAQGADSYSWSNNVSNGISFTPSVGTTLYSVTGTSAEGCTSTDQLNVTVHPNPVVSAGSDQTLCQGTSAVLSGSGALTYSWDNNVVNSVQFLPPSGNTVYTVTGTDSNGCINTDQVSVSVIDVPIPTFQFNGVGCVPLNVTLTNTTSNVEDCSWFISNGDEISSCGVVSTTLTQAGCYDVTLTTTVNGCSSTFTAYDLICAEEAPIADFTFSPETVSTLNPEVHFENLSNGSTSYSWDFGDDSPLSNETDPVHVFPDNTSSNYEVMLVAYSLNGCTDTAYAFITVEEEILFWVPNTFTPDGDIYNQTFDPVFTSGFDPYDYHLTIFNRWGEIVFESFDHEYGWDGSYGGMKGGTLHNCQDGIYTWKIEYKFKNNDERKVAVGHVTLIR